MGKGHCWRARGSFVRSQRQERDDDYTADPGGCLYFTPVDAVVNFASDLQSRHYSE